MRVFSCLLLIIGSYFAKALPATRMLRNWSDWSDWSECSRSCGSGVTSQHRSCISGCGESQGEELMEQRYQSCCIQNCPSGTMDFLLQQCFTGGSGNWTSAVKEAGECGTILCEEDVNGTIRTMSLKVAPGTPCASKHGESGVCLGDQCAVVGCDGILGSGLRKDKCLHCPTPLSADSAATTPPFVCRAMNGRSPTLRPLQSQGAIVPVLVLQEYYTSITITHPLTIHEGRLAVKSMPGGHVFMGGLNDTKFEAAGTIFHYLILREDGDTLTEQLTATGPFSQRLRVEIIGASMDSTPVAYYTYHELRSGTETEAQNHTHQHPPPSSVPTDEPSRTIDFTWRHKASNCSRQCGRGLRTLVPRCTDVDYPERGNFPERRCEDLEKPLPIVEECNMRNCQAEWYSGSWSLCSQKCAGGTQTRTVQCRRPLEEGEGSEVVDSTHCSHNLQPVAARSCNSHSCDVEWAEGEWSNCTSVKFDGVQSRTVECRETASEHVLDGSTHCRGILKPDSVRICREANCDESGNCYCWRGVSEECNNTCGFGYKTVNITCHTCEGARHVDDSLCEGLVKPPAEEACWDTSGDTCEPEWIPGDYGECVGECCSNRIAYRTVQCMDRTTNHDNILLPDAACAGQLKPSNQTTCDASLCPDWIEFPWGQCMGRCQDQQGLQERNVTCTSITGKPVHDTLCSSCRLKPPEVRPCATPTCPPLPPCRNLDEDTCKMLPQHLCSSDLFIPICPKKCCPGTCCDDSAPSSPTR